MNRPPPPNFRPAPPAKVPAISIDSLHISRASTRTVRRTSPRASQRSLPSSPTGSPGRGHRANTRCSRSLSAPSIQAPYSSSTSTCSLTGAGDDHFVVGQPVHVAQPVVRNRVHRRRTTATTGQRRRRPPSPPPRGSYHRADANDCQYAVSSAGSAARSPRSAPRGPPSSSSSSSSSSSRTQFRPPRPTTPPPPPATPPETPPRSPPRALHKSARLPLVTSGAAAAAATTTTTTTTAAASERYSPRNRSTRLTPPRVESPADSPRGVSRAAPDALAAAPDGAAALSPAAVKLQLMQFKLNESDLSKYSVVQVRVTQEFEEAALGDLIDVGGRCDDRFWMTLSGALLPVYSVFPTKLKEDATGKLFESGRAFPLEEPYLFTNLSTLAHLIQHDCWLIVFFRDTNWDVIDSPDEALVELMLNFSLDGFAVGLVNTSRTECTRIKEAFGVIVTPLIKMVRGANIYTMPRKPFYSERSISRWATKGYERQRGDPSALPWDLLSCECAGVPLRGSFVSRV